MSDPLLVSVIIPIKGRSRFFAQTVGSLTDQAHLHWEAVVVDDGSAPEEFRRIAATAGGDARIRLIRNPGPRTGACACRNAGFAASTGRYVVFLDSDDALAPGCLQRRIAVLERNPAVDFAVFPLWIFLERPGDSERLWNDFTEENDLDRFLHSDDAPWQTAGPIWRRESLARTGLWEERALSWQDWEFHVRILAQGLRYVKVAEPDGFWRWSDSAGSISGQRTLPRHVLNHARLVRWTAARLRAQAQLTPARRRILSTHFFRLAFRTGLPRRASALVWRTGRRARIVSGFEFGAVRAIERLIPLLPRVGRRLESVLFPDLRRTPRFGRVQKPVPADSLPRGLGFHGEPGALSAGASSTSP